MVTNRFELDDSVDEYFPRHGWIAGRTGHRHLRFPVKALFGLGSTGYERLHELKLSWTAGSPYKRLTLLANSLRELHYEIRNVISLSEDWRENGNLIILSNQRIDIYLISAFTVLRRFPDVLLETARPLLFEHFQSAPRELKVYRRKSVADFEQLKPRCDPEILHDAIQFHTKWFDKIRGRNTGIRDVLMHNEYLILNGAQGARGPDEEKTRRTYQSQFYVGSEWLPSKKKKPLDLIQELRGCVGGLCAFMEQLHRSFGMCERRYDRNDVFLCLPGSASCDNIGFWPSIIAGEDEVFPAEPMTAAD